MWPGFSPIHLVSVSCCRQVKPLCKGLICWKHMHIVYGTGHLTKVRNKAKTQPRICLPTQVFCVGLDHGRGHHFLICTVNILAKPWTVGCTAERTSYCNSCKEARGAGRGSGRKVNPHSVWKDDRDGDSVRVEKWWKGSIRAKVLVQQPKMLHLKCFQMSLFHGSFWQLLCMHLKLNWIVLAVNICLICRQQDLSFPQVRARCGWCKADIGTCHLETSAFAGSHFWGALVLGSRMET